MVWDSLAQGCCEDSDDSLCYIEHGLEQDVNKRPWDVETFKRVIKL
jgi:hypothetical protein